MYVHGSSHPQNSNAVLKSSQKPNEYHLNILLHAVTKALQQTNAPSTGGGMLTKYLDTHFCYMKIRTYI